MILYLPEGLPVTERLRSEGVEVCGYNRCQLQDLPLREGERLLRILFLNLMPQKEVTELDIARAMAQPDVSVQLIPMKIAGQTYKTTPMAHMQTYYTDFEQLAAQQYDGMIVTGAPIEHLPFEDVNYWPQLCDIMAWATTHVRSTLYICWGAQAGLYYHFNVPKYMLPAKKFGIYEQTVLKNNVPLFDGLAPVFPMPNSRHTEVRGEDFPTGGSLEIVANSVETGVAVAMAHGGREIFTVGHLEYEPYTLHHEYQRDLGKGLPIDLPQHYYVDDQPEKGVRFQWQEAGRRFYRNWLMGYCLA